MDEHTPTWLHTRSPKLHAVMEERRLVLGTEQARAFWAGVFTDDFQFYFISTELAAIGARLWCDQNEHAKIQMCRIHKKQLGTVIDGIGASNVINGGFICTIPSKRAKAVANCTRALRGQLTRDEYESNNGLLVHLQAILDLPSSALQGIARRLKLLGFGDNIVHLTENASDRYEEIVTMLENCSGASFLCSVPDALTQQPMGSHSIPAPKIHMTSDACTDAEQPAIFGIALGVYYYFALDKEWLGRSINVLEAAGRGLNYLVLGSSLPNSELVNEGDNINAIASGLHTAKAADLQAVQRALENCASYAQIAERSWESHIAGIGKNWPMQEAGRMERALRGSLRYGH